MFHSKMSCAVVAIAALTAFHCAARAGTINNAPPTGFTGYLFDPETAGGTFVADDVVLQKVTLYLSSSDDGFSANLRAVVFATDGLDAPTGSPLWESADFTSPAGEPLVPVTFIINLPTTPGEHYFVGVDSGALTTAPTSGNNYRVGITDDNILGTFWDFNANVSGVWTQSADIDIAAGVILADTPFVPAPAALPAGLIGLGVLASRRRRA